MDRALERRRRRARINLIEEEDEVHGRALPCATNKSKRQRDWAQWRGMRYPNAARHSGGRGWRLGGAPAPTLNTMMILCGASAGFGGSGNVAAKWDTFSGVRTSAAVRKA